MGEPTEPGDDQESTIIIEGPPAAADVAARAAFENQFKKFKQEVRAVFKSYPEFKIRLRKIKYIKKQK